MSQGMETEANQAREIVESLRATDPDRNESGARALVEHFGEPLLNYLVHGMRLGTDDAEDVLNTVFYRAVIRIDQLRQPERLGGWLFRLAFSAASDHHRRSRGRPEIPTEPYELARTADTRDFSDEEDGSDDPETTTLGKAIQSLSERDQEVVSAIAHDLSNEEIAEMLSVTPAHARVLRHRALDRLRQAYARVISLEDDSPPLASKDS